MKLFNRRPAELEVGFCERCGRVVRADAAREQALLEMLANGWRTA